MFRLNGINTPDLYLFDKKRKLRKHKLKFQHETERHGSVWNRQASSTLFLVQLTNKYQPWHTGFGNSLTLSDSAVGGLGKGSQPNDHMLLSQSVTVAGGRTAVGSSGPPIAGFDSPTFKGQAVYISGTGQVDLAQADGPVRSRVAGLSNQTVISGSGEYINGGPLDQEDWTAVTGTMLLESGAYYYLSATEPGKLSLNAPEGENNYVSLVGLAISPTTMYVSISQPILL